MSQPNQVTVQIDDDEPSRISEVQPRNSVNAFHLDTASRPVLSNRNNMGFGDRLNNVFREIRPLVEHARMGNNARLSLPTWLPRQHSVTQVSVDATPPRAQSSIAHVNLGSNAQTYAVNDRMAPMQGGNSNVLPTTPSETNLSEHSVNADVNISVNPASLMSYVLSNNNINDNAENDSQSEDGVQQAVDVRSFVNMAIKYAPFYLLHLMKFTYDSWEGLFTFGVLFFTFVQNNNLVRREHGKQVNRSQLSLALGLVFTLGTIYIMHYLFGHDRLLQNLIRFPTYIGPMSVWELLWLVCLTDLLAKLLTIAVKIIVTMMPASVLPFQKRGKVYLFVESVSQVYRSLLAIQPWFYYLINAYLGKEKMVGMFLACLYVFAKFFEVMMKLQLFKHATWVLLQSANLGTKPTHEQLMLAGDVCPICHDDYTTPLRLKCGHIFCELCIATWLDRDHTCPLCRAKVADEPTWRDGSTSYEFQLY